MVYEWKDTSEELHYSLALLLRDEVRKLSVKPQTDGTLSKWTVTHDFQQCGILTHIDSDEPVQPPLKLRNSK